MPSPVKCHTSRKPRKTCGASLSSKSTIYIPVDSWEDSKDYIIAKTFVLIVKTTNDLAERAIKMATDYAQILTKDEDTRRRIIQGVEDHRRAYPDFKKSSLNK